MIVSDRFADVAATVITAHTAEKGGAWMKHGSTTPNLVVAASGQGLISSAGSGVALAYSATAPPAQEQCVMFSVRMGSTTDNKSGAACRVATGAITGVVFYYDADNEEWVLAKYSAGTETQLDTFADSNSSGRVAWGTLDARDDKKRGYVDGELVCESTDNTITGAGKWGPYQLGNVATGVTVDRFWSSSATLASSDSFEGTNNQGLEQHLGDTRAVWIRSATSGTGTGLLLNPTGDAVISSSSFTARDYLTCVPSSVDQDVHGIVVVGSDPGANVGLHARLHTSSYQWYVGSWSGAASTFALTAQTSSTASAALGTYPITPAPPPGTKMQYTLEVTDGEKALWVDGVKVITSADNSVTAANRVGIQLNGSGSTTQSISARSRLGAFWATTAIADAAGPNAVTITGATAAIAAIDLTWNATTDVGSAGVNAYRARARIHPAGDWFEAGVFASTKVAGSIFGLDPGTEYDVRVDAMDTYGNLTEGANTLAATPTAAPPPPPGWNDITGTHSGSVTVNQTSLTVDSTAKSALYGGGITTFTADDAFDVTSPKTVFDAVGGLTLRAIVKPTTIPAGVTERVIIDRQGGWSLRMAGSSLKGTVVIGAVATSVTVTGVFSANVTADVAMVFDGTELQLYVDGEAVGSPVAVVGTVDASGTNITIGGLAGPTLTFVGYLQEVEALYEALTVGRLVEDALAVA